MPKEILWNMSTSIRNPERIPGFLEVLMRLEGEIWDKACQEKFQVMLIQHRKYLSDKTNTQTFRGLSDEQINLLKDKDKELTYKQAEAIFLAKNYEDPAMRGRQSFNPLRKLGLVYIESGRVRLSDVGLGLVSHKLNWEDFILDSMLKYQLSNPATRDYKTWDVKPFIAVLHLIKQVNWLCSVRNEKPIGISKEEFGIFALSLKNYKDIEATAERLLAYRAGLKSLEKKFDAYKDLENARKQYTESYILDYLKEYSNAAVNVSEYGDSMMRYLRQTKYIRILGKYEHQYIDLEPRRMIEIESILQTDNASAKKYNEAEWICYMGTYGAYELPFETIPALTRILQGTLAEIRSLEQRLGKEEKYFSAGKDKQSLKRDIEKARAYRQELQNLELKLEYSENLSKIGAAIEMLNDIARRKKDNLTNKLPIELEKWTNIALNIINDANYIKLNAPVGDDNEPIFTAPAGVPDIECHYGQFNAICEVTMLSGRDQWFNEGQPVMRHLREFELKNTAMPNYCLFIAPQLHEDTLETYWVAVRHGYKGKTQKIIPMKIAQFLEILQIAVVLKQKGQSLRKAELMDFYERCAEISEVSSSEHWPAYIDMQLENWKTKVTKPVLDS